MAGPRLVTSANAITLRDVVPGAQPQTTLTLSGGAATPLYGSHVIAAESGTTDDFDTVNLTNLRAADVVEWTVDTGDTITFTNGVGNITTNTGASIVATAGQTVRTKVNAAADGVIASLVGGASVLDEDDFASDSATRPPSQQSAKAYVDKGGVITTYSAQAINTAASFNLFDAGVAGKVWEVIARHATDPDIYASGVCVGDATDPILRPPDETVGSLEFSFSSTTLRLDNTSASNGTYNILIRELF